MTVAYFLVHSIGEGDFAEHDLDSARVFAHAAREAGVERLVYLGGFVPHDEGLSEHLESRADVGDALGEAGVELVWLRAAIVLGAGSTSFELIRHDRARRRLFVPFPPVSPKTGGDRRVVVDPVARELTADLVRSLPNSMDTQDHELRSIVGDKTGGATTVAEALRRVRVPNPVRGLRDDRPAAAGRHRPGLGRLRSHQSREWSRRPCCSPRPGFSVVLLTTLPSAPGGLSSRTVRCGDDIRCRGASREPSIWPEPARP